MAEILYFSTAQCGPCKILKPIVQQVATETGRHVTYIDAEASPDLALRYNVRKVPTIIVSDNGNIIYQHSGNLSKQQLASLFNNYR